MSYQGDQAVVEMQTNNPATARAIIERMSARPRLAPDRMPVLTAIMERLAVAGTEYLRRLCAPQMVFLISQLGISSSTELLESDKDAIASVFIVPEWDRGVLIGVDRPFVDAVMEGAFGGDGSELVPDNMRAFTPLDVRVVRAILYHMAAALAECFQPISKISLIHERIETRLDPQTLGPKPYDVIVVRLAVQAFGGEGQLFVCLPAASLAQFRSQFERTSATNQPVDPAWTKQLEVEVGQASVSLQAVLGEFRMTLSQISRLQVGQLIELGVQPGSPVILEGSEERIFSCRLGQSNRNFVLTIEDDVAQARDGWT